jgi:hypothetical protein
LYSPISCAWLFALCAIEVTRNTILSSMIDSGQKLDQIEISLRRLLSNRGVSGSESVTTDLPKLDGA